MDLISHGVPKLLIFLWLAEWLHSVLFVAEQIARWMVSLCYLSLLLVMLARSLKPDLCLYGKKLIITWLKGFRPNSNFLNRT